MFIVICALFVLQTEVIYKGWICLAGGVKVKSSNRNFKNTSSPDLYIFTSFGGWCHQVLFGLSCYDSWVDVRSRREILLRKVDLLLSKDHFLGQKTDERAFCATFSDVYQCPIIRQRNKMALFVHVVFCLPFSNHGPSLHGPFCWLDHTSLVLNRVPLSTNGPCVRFCPTWTKAYVRLVVWQISDHHIRQTLLKVIMVCVIHNDLQMKSSK